MTVQPEKQARLFFRPQVLSWALYDFANSAFATTILSVVFNVYFVRVICADGVEVFGRVIPGESFWGYSLAASTLIVFVLAPILGAVADESSSKKKFLFVFTCMGCVFSALLSLCAEGDHWMAAAFFMLANTGFYASAVFYNSLINGLADSKSLGRVSGFGWALGYIGGGLLLAVNLFMIKSPESFGIPAENHWPVRISVLSAAAWWAVFSAPLFLWVKETARANPVALNLAAVRKGFGDVAHTFRKIRESKEIFKYLAAYLVYNDGIETVIVMASIFAAKELGMPQSDLILCFLMIQAVAFLGAMIFGYAADHIGHKRSIAITLWIYTAVCLYAMVIRTTAEFWILGAVIGIILGGSQAASRSLLALMVPRESEAQFFGFFALTGKLATAIGPVVFAVLSQFYSLRVAVGSLAMFFVVGLVLLHFVREPEIAHAT